MIAALVVGVAVGIGEGVEVGAIDNEVGCDVRVGKSVSVGCATGMDVVLEAALARVDELGVRVISTPTSKALQAVKVKASRNVREILSFMGPPVEPASYYRL